MVQRGAVEDPSAIHADRVAWQPVRTSPLARIGVGQRGAELRAIVAQIRIQKVSLSPSDQNLEAAQMPRIAVEKSECLERGIYDVAGRLEDRETSPVREHLVRTARGERRGQHIVVGADFDNGLRWLRGSPAFCHDDLSEAPRLSGSLSHRQCIIRRDYLPTASAYSKTKAVRIDD